MEKNASASKQKIKVRQPVKKKKKTSLFSFQQGKIDSLFLLLLIIIVIIGIVSLFSASFASAYKLYGDSFNFIRKQIIFAIGGIAAMLLISSFNYEIIERFVLPSYVITMFLLISVFAFDRLKGARRWIIIGNRSFQPTEIAKFVLIIMVAHLLVEFQSQVETFKFGIMPTAVTIGPMLVLVVLEPHLSATILMAGITACMLYAGGVRFRWLLLAGGILALSLFIMIQFNVGPKYALDRIEIWQNYESTPLDDGYQTAQSLNAIGSGGTMGKGIGGSTQKYDDKLPELQNDYIFAIVAEEVGFVGSVLILFLFALLLWRGFMIAINCPDRFGALVGIGLISQVGLQLILNIMIVTNIVPPTGMPLPFFSAGGTSLIMMLMQMGVLLSISRTSGINKEEVEG